MNTMLSMLSVLSDSSLVHMNIIYSWDLMTTFIMEMFALQGAIFQMFTEWICEWKTMIYY